MAKKNPAIDKEFIAKTSTVLIELQSNKLLLDPFETPPVDVSKFIARETKRVMLMKDRCFLNQEEVTETKRYSRFIERIKDDCYEFIRNMAISDCIDYDGFWMKKESFEYLSSLDLCDMLLAKTASLIFTNFNDCAIDSRYKYYLQNFNNSTNQMFSFGVPFYTTVATISEFAKEKNEYVWKMLVDKPKESIEGIDETGHSICLYELENVIKDSILNRGFFDDEVNKDNYTTTLDVNMLDIQEILQETVCRIIGHIYGLSVEIGDGSTLDTVSGKNKQIEEQKEQINILSRNNDEMASKIIEQSDEINNKQHEIDKLRKELKEIKRTHTAELNKLKKEIRLLNHKTTEKTPKVKTPSKTTEEKDEEFTPKTSAEIVEVKECDTNLRYLFVVGDSMNKNLLNRIENEFPNAKLEDATRNINPQDVDVVVFLTKYIPHRLAYSYKNQCVAKGIDYIYTDKTNIEQIKADIASHNHLEKGAE